MLNSIKNTKNRKQREEFKELIQYCHSAALAYLRIKAANNTLHTLGEIRLEEMARSSIAGMFETNKEFQSINHQRFFDRYNLNRLNKQDIRIELRRYVMMMVDDKVYRALVSEDPSIKEMVWDLTVAISENNSLQPIYCENEILFIADSNYSDHPTMPSELMQIRLSSRIKNKNPDIADLLAEVVQILDNQKIYRKQFSLVKLSHIIRELPFTFKEADQKQTGRIRKTQAGNTKVRK